jgi:hypothetical protein
MRKVEIQKGDIVGTPRHALSSLTGKPIVRYFQKRLHWRLNMPLNYWKLTLKISEEPFPPYVVWIKEHQANIRLNSKCFSPQKGSIKISDLPLQKSLAEQLAEG